MRVAREARIAVWTSGHEQRRQHAGEQAAGAGHDDVGPHERLADLGNAARPIGDQPDLQDAPAGRRDRRFAAQHAAVLELCDQRHQLARRRQDRAARADHPRRDFHRAREVIGHVGERRQHQVADRVSVQAVAAAEPVLEDVGDERVIVGKSRQAVADVSRRDHVELGAQLSRAAPVVGGRHDRDEPLAPGRRVLRARAAQQRTQATQHVGQTSAAAERHDARQRFVSAGDVLTGVALGLGGTGHHDEPQRRSAVMAPVST